jgi:hypothetical protein
MGRLPRPLPTIRATRMRPPTPMYSAYHLANGTDCYDRYIARTYPF